MMIDKIADYFGTPLYIYDAEEIEKNYSKLKQCFSHTDVFYSIKANPNIAICNVLKNCGSGAEVCSLAELETVVRAGFNPDNIIFVGPYKSNKTLERCIELGIYAIVCESKQEFLQIAELAKQKSCVVNVAIRINPGFVSKSALLKMGGKASQFGIDQDQVIHDEKFYLNNPHINIIGFHIYNGTRILDAETIYSNTLNILEISQHIMKKWQHPISMVDMGGGLGIPYFSNENELDITKLEELISPFIKDFHQQFPNIRLILESGRFLVGSAGKLVSRVQVIKKSNNELFLITDGGTNCHMAAVGIGSIVKNNFPITLITNTPSEKRQRYHITGPLCTPNDLVGRSIELPIAKEGDLVVINASGAYGPTASPVNFLSHGYPAEVLINQGRAKLVRERDTVEDLLKNQRV